MLGSHNQNPGSSTQEEVGERGVRTYQLWKKTDSDIWGANVVKNIARSQNAAPSTSYWLSRYQVVLTKRLLPEIEYSKFGFWVLSQFECCHNLSIWLSSQFEHLSIVAIWVFEFLCYLSGQKLSFVTIWVFAFCHN